MSQDHLIHWKAWIKLNLKVGIEHIIYLCNKSISNYRIVTNNFESKMCLREKSMHYWWNVKVFTSLWMYFTAIATHDYIVKIVPSVYEDSRGNLRYPYQYTFSYRVRPTGSSVQSWVYFLSFAVCWKDAS